MTAFDRALASGARPSPSSSTKWSCSGCTFLNTATATTCRACAQARGASDPAASDPAFQQRIGSFFGAQKTPRRSGLRVNGAPSRRSSSTSSSSSSSSSTSHRSTLPYRQLDQGQRDVFDVAMAGHSFFFTGAAGTGKSHLLRLMVAQLMARFGPDAVFVTAPTGAAACNVGGCTIHSFAGVGFGNKDAHTIVTRMRPNVRRRWQSCAVLVVDEVSMLSAHLFDLVEAVARGARRDQRPFGGIQVILSGDFFQLPPVERGGEPRFAFEADAWPRVVGHSMCLTRVFRQADDAFVTVLNQVRLGHDALDAHSLATLRALVAKPMPARLAGGIEPSRLYSHRMDVATVNRRQLAQLRGREHTFVAQDGGDAYLRRQLASCAAPEELTLKEGAQVILLKNVSVSEGLYNGSRGVVTGFVVDPEEGAEVPLVRFAGGAPVVVGRQRWDVTMGGVTASRIQIPLQLAWALTIHKSQGMTIDWVVAGLANCFTYGQAYVALSRATSLAGLKLVDLEVDRITAHPRVLDFYRDLERQQRERVGEDAFVPLLPPSIARGNSEPDRCEENVHVQHDSGGDVGSTSATNATTSSATRTRVRSRIVESKKRSRSASMSTPSSCATQQQQQQQQHNSANVSASSSSPLSLPLPPNSRRRRPKGNTLQTSATSSSSSRSSSSSSSSSSQTCPKSDTSVAIANIINLIDGEDEDEDDDDVEFVSYAHIFGK